ncbi:hypothetical protein DAEQUDRAFT_373794 [Daedalea quercina L-15889]|uniref:Uncharacterized protein n=1 Tax=Daedalea quercina L-15889 TaxID=1314783 RepID=A0A165P6Q6_9APHY|nr:hypothetical protein DAEQUDRAFT_373794 [Daedalea quercina L-15889]
MMALYFRTQRAPRGLPQVSMPNCSIQRKDRPASDYSLSLSRIKDSGITLVCDIRKLELQRLFRNVSTLTREACNLCPSVGPRHVSRNEAHLPTYRRGSSWRIDVPFHTYNCSCYRAYVEECSLTQDVPCASYIVASLESSGSRATAVNASQPLLQHYYSAFHGVFDPPRASGPFYGISDTQLGAMTRLGVIYQCKG